MSDSSDKQLTVGDCGRLLPPTLRVLLIGYYIAVAGTDREASKRYKLQHTNAFVSYNSENEGLFGCKLCRTTCSVREDKLCPPSLSKSSFDRL